MDDPIPFQALALALAPLDLHHQNLHRHPIPQTVHIFFPLDCDVQTVHNFHPFSGKNLFSFWISANKIEHEIFAHESTLPKMFISMNCLVTTITEEFPTVPTGHLVATFSFRDSHFTSGTLLRIAKRFTDIY